MAHYFDEQLNQPMNGGLSIRGLTFAPIFKYRDMDEKLRNISGLTQHLFVLILPYLHGQTRPLNLTEEQILTLAPDEASIEKMINQ